MVSGLSKAKTPSTEVLLPAATNDAFLTLSSLSAWPYVSGADAVTGLPLRGMTPAGLIVISRYSLVMELSLSPVSVTVTRKRYVPTAFGVQRYVFELEF